MPESKDQKQTVEPVPHEFKHGDLESGTGKKVTNPKQAVAIALHEAGASKTESDEKNAENLRRTKRKENEGRRRPARQPRRLPLTGRTEDCSDPG